MNHPPDPDLAPRLRTALKTRTRELCEDFTRTHNVQALLGRRSRMVDDALSAVQRACPPGTAVDVQMDWDSEWSPERLAPALRERFGW